LLIGDDLGCFLKELSRHIAQGTDGAECFRRELKNGRRVAHESGRKKRGSEHGNEKRIVTLLAARRVVKRIY